MDVAVSAVLDPMYISAQVRVGGEEGFEAIVTGTFDLVQKIFDLQLVHAGGWSPTGNAAFASPEFTSSLTIGPGTYLDLAADVQFNEDVDLVPSGTLALVAHEGLDEPKPGASLLVRLHRDEGASRWVAAGAFDYTVEMDGAVRLGGLNSSLPIISAKGLVANQYLSASAETTVALKPLDNVNLEIESLTGDLVIDSKDLVMNVHSQCPAFGIDGVIDFSGVTASLDVAVDLENPRGEDLDVALKFQGQVRVGGANSFLFDTVGFVDLPSRALTLNMIHGGGWAPIPSLADRFVFPQFDGTLILGPAVYVSLVAEGSFLEPIVLMPQVATIDAGLSFSVSAERAGGSKVVYSVNAKGSLLLGPSHVGFPALDISGSLASGDAGFPKVELYVNSSGTWQPFPDFLPGFIFPQWIGRFLLHTHGGVEVDVSTIPMDIESAGGALTFVGLRAKVNSHAHKPWSTIVFLANLDWLSSLARISCALSPFRL